MNNLWIIVILSVISSGVFARNCDSQSLQHITSCDECRRCGATWCEAPVKMKSRCNKVKTAWCKNHKSEDNEVLFDNRDGSLLKPVYLRQAAYINNPSNMEFTYKSNEEKKITPIVEGSTEFAVRPDSTNCQNGTCSAVMSVEASVDFCPIKGGLEEAVTVNYRVEGISEELQAVFVVQCACACTSRPQIRALRCNQHGDLLCGVCQCHDGWKGELCEVPVIQTPPTTQHVDVPIMQQTTEYRLQTTEQVDIPIVQRTTDHRLQTTEHVDVPIIQRTTDYRLQTTGHVEVPIIQRTTDYKLQTTGHVDVPIIQPTTENVHDCKLRGDSGTGCINPVKEHVNCSGNGVCNECGECKCFGPEFQGPYCEDICMITGACDNCFTNETPDNCCPSYELILQPYNGTVFEIENRNTSVWTSCETNNEGTLKYVTKKYRNIYIVMVVDVQTADGYTSQVRVTVPAVLCALLLLLAAAGAGLAYMRARARDPPSHANYPYLNPHDGFEECAGENPLYKSPMSSFNNPMYAKGQ